MKIGIVSTSPEIVRVLQDCIAAVPAHKVIWVATEGQEAIDRTARQRPDLMLLDLGRPDVDDPEAARRVIAESPCPVLLVTDSVRANANRVFEAMGWGAIDAVDLGTPDGSTPIDSAHSLLGKLDLVARLVGDHDPDHGGGPRGDSPGSTAVTDRLVVVGASAGGPGALATILGSLPKELPASVVVVQHLDAQFAAGLAEWLGQHSALPVRVAREGEPPQPGVALLAGTSDHLVFTGPGRLGYTASPRDHVYRPSVDVFFESVARQWRGDAVGVLLTGMGRDGALGLKMLRDLGHHTIAQDEGSSALFGMPKAAAALGAAIDVLSIDRIAERLVELLGGRDYRARRAAISRSMTATTASVRTRPFSRVASVGSPYDPDRE